MKTKDKIEMLILILDEDHKAFERGDSIYRLCNYHEGVGLVLPLDWAETWIPELKDAWEGFMHGQTYCVYGFYFCDVEKFLRYKQRSTNA